MTITIHHETADTLHESAIADILHYFAHALKFNLSASTLRRDNFTRTRHVPGIGNVTFTVNK